MYSTAAHWAADGIYMVLEVYNCGPFATEMKNHSSNCIDASSSPLFFFNAVMMLLSSLLTFSCLPSARAEAGAIDESKGEAPAATWSFQPFFADTQQTNIVYSSLLSMYK